MARWLRDGADGRPGIRETLGRATPLDLPPLPPGRADDPGLFGPGSMVWRVGRERALLLGGPAALLLQLAHPLVAAGVAAHSDFRRDPFARLRATLDAVLTISYGDRSQAEAAAEAVMATHRRVRGRLGSATGPFPAGTPYDATDPELGLWVFATLVATAIASYGRFVAPLAPEARRRYYGESKRFAAPFGVGPDVVPPTYQRFRAYVREIVSGPSLEVGPEALALARGVLRPTVPAMLRPSAALMAVVTAGVLPERIGRAYGLPSGPAQRAAFASIGLASLGAVRLLPPSARFWPHYLAARRRTSAGRSWGAGALRQR